MTVFVHDLFRALQKIQNDVLRLTIQKLHNRNFSYHDYRDRRWGTLLPSSK